MVLFATLRRSGGIEAIARHLAIPSAVAQTAIPAAIGPVVEQYRRTYAAGGGGRAGMAHLLALLARFGGGQMAIEVLSPNPVDIDRGEALLAALFGSADQSRTVVQACARDSGLDMALLARALPLLAMLVGGYLAARADGWASEGLSPDQSSGRVAEFERLLTRETEFNIRPAKFDDDDG